MRAWRPVSVYPVAAAPPPRRARALPRVLDVYCGGGGTSLGLTAAGLPVAVGIDFNADALECFHRNHPSAIPLPTCVTCVKLYLGLVLTCVFEGFLGEYGPM